MFIIYRVGFYSKKNNFDANAFCTLKKSQDSKYKNDYIGSNLKVNTYFYSDSVI